MDSVLHNLICERLEQLIADGVATEYLVAWHGPAGRLKPKVTLWPSPECDLNRFEREILWLIGDLVPDVAVIQQTLGLNNKDQPQSCVQTLA